MNFDHLEVIFSLQPILIVIVTLYDWIPEGTDCGVESAASIGFQTELGSNQLQPPMIFVAEN
jgi:hypothetical protein